MQKRREKRNACHVVNTMWSLKEQADKTSNISKSENRQVDQTRPTRLKAQCQTVGLTNQMQGEPWLNP